MRHVCCICAAALCCSCKSIVTSLPLHYVLHAPGELQHALTDLQLSDNHLTILPRELARLSRLQRLTTSGNPLMFPPKAVCRRGLVSSAGSWRYSMWVEDLTCARRCSAKKWPVDKKWFEVAECHETGHNPRATLRRYDIISLVLASRTGYLQVQHH